jgi:class 3 adenylate cyclase
MRCAKCQAENLADSLFCTACGAKMEVPCAACGGTNPAAAKFCRQCGASLSEPAAPPELASAAPGPAEVGERRQLTVLFRDLVGSTPLSQQLDAEEWRDLIAQYQQAAAGAVARYVGRDIELATLVDRWERAAEGEGQNVLVLGEAGVGKSRLVYWSSIRASTQMPLAL